MLAGKGTSYDSYMKMPRAVLTKRLKDAQKRREQKLRKHGELLWVTVPRHSLSLRTPTTWKPEDWLAANRSNPTWYLDHGQAGVPAPGAATATTIEHNATSDAMRGPSNASSFVAEDDNFADFIINSSQDVDDQQTVTADSQEILA